jgi:hypothetical protein
LVPALRAAYLSRPGPMVAGFLRDVFEDDSQYQRGTTLPRVRLKQMDGGTLTLPDDLLGKVVVLQFWSAADPPKPYSRDFLRPTELIYNGLAAAPSKGIVVVGINMDKDRATVEAVLKQNKYPDWIQTSDGLGWDSPLARYFDVFSLPRTIVLNRSGSPSILRPSTPNYNRSIHISVLVGEHTQPVKPKNIPVTPRPDSNKQDIKTPAP